LKKSNNVKQLCQELYSSLYKLTYPGCGGLISIKKILKDLNFEIDEDSIKEIILLHKEYRELENQSSKFIDLFFKQAMEKVVSKEDDTEYYQLSEKIQKRIRALEEKLAKENLEYQIICKNGQEKYEQFDMKLSNCVKKIVSKAMKNNKNIDYIVCEFESSGGEPGENLCCVYGQEYIFRNYVCIYTGQK